MNDQAFVFQIAANASSSDAHSANFIRRQPEGFESILDSNIETKKNGSSGREIIFLHWLAWLMLNRRHDAQTYCNRSQADAGSLPKIGIRPTIDGRLGGVRESLEKQTLEMAKSAREIFRPACAIPTAAGRMRHRRHLHRRRGRGGGVRGEVCARRRGSFADGHALLVLWQRDDGHGPVHAQRRCGVSTARNVPARFIWRRCWRDTRKRACPPSAFTGAMCRTAGDQSIPADVRENCCNLPRRSGGGDHARQILPGDGRRFDGHRRLHGGPAVSLRDYLGMRVESVDMTEFIRRMERGIFDRGGIQERRSPGSKRIAGGQGLQFAQDDAAPARSWTANGKSP
jgi:hypothetical protein